MESHIERAAKLAKRIKRKTRAIKLVDEKTGFELDTVVFARAGCGADGYKGHMQSKGCYWYVPGDEQAYFSEALEEFNTSADHIEKQRADYKAMQREFYGRIRKQVEPLMQDPAIDDEQVCVLGDVMWAVHTLADVSDRPIVLATLKAITAEVSTKRFWKEMNTPEPTMRNEQINAEFIKAFGMTKAEGDAKCAELSKEAQS